MNSTRLHISLNVSNLDASVAFYRKLFGSKPIKLKGNYAKFELEEPRMNVALNLTSEVKPGSSLSHLGFQVDSAAELEAKQKVLERAGLLTVAEEGTCCYAKQSKFWITDPDGVAWEVYRVEADSDEMGESKVKLAAATACC